MTNNQELLKKIEALTHDSEAGFQINNQKVVEEYQHLKENRTNIAIKILSILGIILSVLSFLAALLFLNLLDEKLNLIISGALLLILSIVGLKKYSSIIIDTASITLYAVGGWMLIYGLDTNNTNLILVLCIVISSCTLVIVQRYLLSLLNMLCIIYAIFALIANNFENMIYFAFANALIVVALFLISNHEAFIISKRNFISQIQQPLRTALFLSTLATTAYIVLSHFDTYENSLNTSSIALYLTSITYAVAIIYMIHKIMLKFGITNTKLRITIYTLSLMILVATMINPGISASIFLILLCFYYQYKFGFSLSIIAMLFFLWHFYYNLNFTLLTKSILLLASGALFIAAYFVINITKDQHEEL